MALKLSSHIQHHFGFTLIEVMIAVAIIAILASISYPSYVNYVDDARRSTAKNEIRETKRALEDYYGKVFTLDGAQQALGYPKNIPKDSDTPYYQIDFQVDPNDDSYEIKATPIPDKTMEHDACGSFVYDSKEDKQYNIDASILDCWDE